MWGALSQREWKCARDIQFSNATFCWTQPHFAHDYMQNSFNFLLLQTLQNSVIKLLIFLLYQLPCIAFFLPNCRLSILLLTTLVFLRYFFLKITHWVTTLLMYKLVNQDDIVHPYIMQAFTENQSLTFPPILIHGALLVHPSETNYLH